MALKQYLQVEIDNLRTLEIVLVMQQSPNARLQLKTLRTHLKLLRSDLRLIKSSRQSLTTHLLSSEETTRLHLDSAREFRVAITEGY